MLELIDMGETTESHPVPLLFVHGGWHAAWCWETNFLPYFAGRGFRAAAVSLRGHGKSPCSQPFRSCTVADYADDVEQAADLLGSNPIVIGHSVGGFVTQRYLERRHAPAAVLIASIPSQMIGRMGVTLRIMRSDIRATVRSATTGTAADLVNTPRTARSILFCRDTPESIVESCAARMQTESDHAGGNFVRSNPALVKSPVLVLGADYDGAVSRRAVRATANTFGTQAQFFPMGHNMMLEPGWQTVTENIASWFTTRGL
jgi:pimeloyl-ACP methyl ester carboxylesterase